MPIYEYKENLSADALYDNPHHRECPYCKYRLVSTEIDDQWTVDESELLEIHSQTAEGYKEIHGLEDCYLNLDLETTDIEVYVEYCRMCGWWRLIKQICICAEAWQIWDIFFGCLGSLRNLSLQDINTPLQEVRDYLTAKYESRFTLNPRLFEEITASVFKNHGYKTHVTSITNDGGIDIILYDSSNRMVGVQVKRYKNKITAEQIRSFIGALNLKGITNGIFVSTSDFQKGAINAANMSQVHKVELMDAKRFYDALSIAQLREQQLTTLPFEINIQTVPSISFYGWETPRNSL